MTFVFLFLPIVSVLYLLVRKELRNYVLLLASLLFYAWSEPNYLAIMLLTILVNYAGALGISRCRRGGGRLATLALTVVVNLGILFYFKYFNFVVENINAAFHAEIDLIKVVRPIGISFYTFQALSYVVDVYRREVEAQRDVCKLALYIALFPQLIAGPIVKYHDVKEQIDNREESFEKVAYGVKRFIIGLAKKMLIANTLGAVADKVFSQAADTVHPLMAWVGAIAYSLQLFYDFSGYSDMAIGLGSIFGFKFLENFNYPYISKSITEFWRRWHISLSTWFKEYLYIPLGGNRCGKARNYFNLFTVFLLTGFWHGAAWNFIFWGLWHGVFIIFEKLTGWHKAEGGKGLSLAKHVYTIFVFVIGWVMFRADSMGEALAYLKNMFGMIPEHHDCYRLIYYVDNIELIAFAVGILCAMPIFRRMLEAKNAWLRAGVNAWLLVLFLLSVSSIAASTYNPFIYFRF